MKRISFCSIVFLGVGFSLELRMKIFISIQVIFGLLLIILRPYELTTDQVSLMNSVNLLLRPNLFFE